MGCGQVFTSRLKLLALGCALLALTPTAALAQGSPLGFSQVVGSGLGHPSLAAGNAASLPLMIEQADVSRFAPDIRSQSYRLSGPVARGDNVGLDPVTTSVELRQPLYRSGQGRAQAQLSDSRSRAEEAQAQLEEQEKALSIIKLYLRAQKAQAQFDLMRHANAGPQDIETAAAALTQARSQLHAVAGTPVDRPLMQVTAAPPLPASLQAALDTAEEKHPALRKAHFECAAAEAANRSVKWEDEPDIDLRGALDRTVDRFNENLDEDSGVIGLRATIPLLDEDARKSMLVQARQEAKSGRLAIDSARLEVRQGVIAAWDAVTRARVELAFQQNKARLAHAGAAGRLPKNSRMNGTATAFAVLARQSDLDEIAARTALLQAQFGLLAATGQLLDSLPATPVTTLAAGDLDLMSDFQNDPPISKETSLSALGDEMPDLP